MDGRRLDLCSSIGARLLARQKCVSAMPLFRTTREDACVFGAFLFPRRGRGCVGWLASVETRVDAQAHLLLASDSHMVMAQLQSTFVIWRPLFGVSSLLFLVSTPSACPSPFFCSRLGFCIDDTHCVVLSFL